MQPLPILHVRAPTPDAAVRKALAASPLLAIVGSITLDGRAEGPESPSAVFAEGPVLDAPREGLERLRVAPGATRLPLVVLANDERWAVEAIRRGAVAYLPTRPSAREVQDAVAAVRAALPLDLAYPDRLAVPVRGGVRIVPLDEVDYIGAADSYAVIHTGGDALPLRESLRSLEARLPPDRFCRVHRSAIVPLRRVTALLTAPGGDYAVRLLGDVELPVSRTRRELLARRLGVASG